MSLGVVFRSGRRGTLVAVLVAVLAAAVAGWLIGSGVLGSTALAVGVPGLVLLVAGLVLRLARAEARQGDAATALAVSEANLRALTENATMGISVFRNGRYVLANRHVARRLGYSPEEFAQISIGDVVHPDDRAMVLDRYRRRLAGEDVPSRYEARMVTKDGQTLMIEVNAAVTQWDGQPADIVFTTDVTERKAAEIALAKSEGLFRSLAQFAPVGIFRMDVAGQITYCNERSSEIAGIPPEQVLGTGWLSALHPDDRERIRGRLTDALAARRPLVSEYRFVHPDGKIVWVTVESQPEYVDGEEIGRIGMATNITERKTAEIALAKSEALFRSLAQFAPVGIFRMDVTGQITYCNERISEIAGIPSEAVLGTGWLSALHPEDRERIRGRLAQALEARLPLLSEYRFVHPDGKLVWVMVESRPEYVDGEEIGRIGMVTNITERKTAEIELAAARARLTDATDTIEHSLALWDPEDRLVLFNQRFRDQFPGWDLIQVGLRFEDFVRAVALAERGAAGSRPETEPDLETVVAARVARHRRADGAPILRHLADGRVLRVSERPARSGGGIVGTAIDITEQLRTEHQLREALKMEAIGKLTGGMAHDFNNYVAVILGNLELLEKYGADDPDSGGWVGGAKAGAMRAAELTRSLLAFARRQPLDPRPTDVNRRVGAIAELLRRTLGEDVSLVTMLAPDLWPVTIDGAQLDACIVNLANNARDAMPRGGSLSITTRNIALDESYARANLGAAAGDHVLIEMSDSGAGMSPEVAASAFEPFFTTKKHGHGTGLGLSMVYGFVKQSGGHIKIDSAVGTGTAVRVYLPRDLVTATTAPAANDAQTAAQAGGAETILIVEDNEQMRQMAATTLTRHGYQVIEAANGAAALAVLDQRALSIDLLFTDIVMPGGLDGHELAQVARERRPDIRVLLTSGYTGGRFHDHDIDVPTANLLRKPYPLDDLLRAVRAALDSTAAASRRSVS